MQTFLEQQERVLARLLEGTPLPGEVAPQAAPVAAEVFVEPAAPAAETSDAPLEAAALKDQLIALVSDATGYPADFVKPDIDLEAELGVNSIKRIDIIGKMIAALPDAYHDQVQGAFGKLVAAKSIDGLVRAILDAAALAPTPAPAITASGGSCARAVMTPSESPLPVERAVALDGLCIVTADREGLAERVIADLRLAGITTFIVSPEDLLDDDRLATRIAVLRLIHGPVRGVVHLAGFVRRSTEDPALWQASCASGTARLLALLKGLTPEIEEAGTPLRIVSAAPMPNALQRAPAGGGPHGLLRSLMEEAPHILAKTIDIDGELPEAEITNRIAAELLVPGGGSEIAIAQGKRLLFEPELAPLAPGRAEADWRPQPGWVVLVTGGARGITAALTEELAGPGVRLVLVGRRALDEKDEALERFRGMGAEVEYHAVDVADGNALGALIDAIHAEHGRIDAVLHGAGVIEDGRIANKDPTSFARVFDTKVASTFALYRHLRAESLKWVVLMGSISGRFGNHGQADYAAANETMARLGQDMRRVFPDSRVLTIAWGPWNGAGMASEGVQAQLRAQGIVPIPVDQGRQFFVDEMRWGDPALSEVIAGDGPWTETADSWLGPILAAATRVLHFEERSARVEEAA